MRIHFVYAAGLLSLLSCVKPIARFEMSAKVKEAPAIVSIKNESTHADSYSWNFGDGTTAKDTVSSHRFTHAGKYDVTLTAIKGKKSNVMTQSIVIDPPAKCLIEISTDYGVMTAELSDATPQHRNNFLKLAEEGYYDGLLFHRVIDGFMIQGGDPNSRNAAPGVPLGSGGPGYQIPAEFVDSLIHVKGAIAAARTSDAVNPEKKSSGSQFYIVQGGPVDQATLLMLENRKGFKYTEAQKKAYLQHGGTPQLDHDYTVFGHLISGFDVLDKIAKVERDGRDRPKKDVKMTIKVIR
ncbi:MAG TPA: peptidylprolyl isomerase [Saprospiraceae bacterium]|nr:peptidylprolyl isomerase [Saprospiraceae bacterium]